MVTLQGASSKTDLHRSTLSPVSLLKQLYRYLLMALVLSQVYSFTGDRAMAVYGYTRVSTGRQAEEGESLGTQQRRIEGHAMVLGLQVDKMFVERGVSGSTRLHERPKGAKLLDTLKPGDVIITPKLDRMFRSALDALDVLAKLKDAGVSLHMIDLGGDVTGNGISKLVFTILSAVAEAERDRIRERIRDVKADQKKRNRYLGGSVPFGWALSDGGELVKDDAQQAAIRRMKTMHAKGASLRAISAELAQDGFTISHVGVKNILDAGGDDSQGGEEGALLGD